MTVQVYLMFMHGCRCTHKPPLLKQPQIFKYTFVKSCFTSYLAFVANPVLSYSLPVFLLFLFVVCLLSLQILGQPMSLCLSPVVPAWLHPHARPFLSVVKMILIYNGSHYKHVRKQHHGDGAQTKSQCGSVFIRSASPAESALQCVYILYICDCVCHCSCG